MEYKIVDVTGGEQGTYIFGVEEKIKAELAQGWKLWGSLIVIPSDFEGDKVRIWQAMVKDEGWMKYPVAEESFTHASGNLSDWELNGDDFG